MQNVNLDIKQRTKLQLRILHTECAEKYVSASEVQANQLAWNNYLCLISKVKVKLSP
jgi:hypothetical protein